MGEEPQKPPTFLWTQTQRRVLIGGLLLLLAVLTIQRLLRPHYVNDPQPITFPRHPELADRIDPNTADASDLAALPMIGPRRAADIVKFRNQYLSKHPGGLAFKSPDDLLRIDGVGIAMLESVRPYLLFPSDHRPNSTTHPTIGRE